MSESEEPFVLINLFSMPPEAVDGFIEAWPANTAPAAHDPGFRGTRLHRALDPDAEYPVVNIARWDSVEAWQTTVQKHFFTPREGAAVQDGQAGPISFLPALYRVVHVTPDPTEGGASS